MRAGGGLAHAHPEVSWTSVASNRPPVSLKRLTPAAGIMPIMTYGGFKRMTSFCKTRVPEDIAAAVEANKDNEEAMKVWRGVVL
jgi:hypothetical protein